MNRKKLALALMLLLVLVATAPTVSAAIYDDDWYIDTSIEEVETDHPELEPLDVEWTGEVTPVYEYQHPYLDLYLGIKNTALVGYYGFADSGVVLWDGGVTAWSLLGTSDYYVYELNYSIVEPRSAILSTTVKNPQYQYVWNGKNWEQNTYTVTVVDGRTYVTYNNPN